MQTITMQCNTGDLFRKKPVLPGTIRCIIEISCRWYIVHMLLCRGNRVNENKSLPLLIGTKILQTEITFEMPIVQSEANKSKIEEKIL